MKNIIKPIVFLIILFILLEILSYVFSPKNNIIKDGMDKHGEYSILGEDENTIDMIIYGNSESFTSIIPLKLWEDYGYASYICGRPGQHMPAVIQTIYTSNKKQKPKVIVLEANSIYENVPITIPFAKVVQVLLPISEYHYRWKELEPADFYSPINYTETDYMKGFYYKTNCEPADATGYMDYTEEIEPIKLKEKIYFNIINEYCEKNDIKLIVISVPSTKNWSYKKHNAVEQLTSSKNIPFIDFNILADELQIDWEKDTLDQGDHMNYNGSLKLTDYFGKYLNAQNILPNHKGEAKYEKWDEDVKLYKETTKDSGK